jgi:hypothetical protein
MTDYLVTYYIPVVTRVENAPDRDTAAGIANDWRTEQKLFDAIDAGLDQTSFEVDHRETWALDVDVAVAPDSALHAAAILTGGTVPAHVPGAYPNLSCCGGEVQLVAAR